ncbi:MAG: hypothetical protein ACTXOO_02120 [Sodalis sp. (in: enterobacteria)]
MSVILSKKLKASLNGKQSKLVYDRIVNGDAEAYLIALSCSEPPERQGQQTLQLLADNAIKL